MNTNILNEKRQRYLGYLAQDETNINLLLSVARLFHHFEKLDEAIELLMQYAHHHDENADLAGLLALLYFDIHDATSAELSANKALALNPSQYEGQLVNILLNTLRNKATLGEINALLSVAPDESRLLFALGTTQMRHMNLPAAEAAFFRAVEIAPYFYETWISIGMCSILQNKLDKAQNAYQYAIDIEPHRADGHAGLALSNALESQVPQAQQYLEKAMLLNAECSLIPLAQMILNNSINPQQAGAQFITLFNSTL